MPCRLPGIQLCLGPLIAAILLTQIQEGLQRCVGAQGTCAVPPPRCPRAQLLGLRMGLGLGMPILEGDPRLRSC